MERNKEGEGHKMVGARNLVRGLHYFKTPERNWLTRSLQIGTIFVGGQREPEINGRRNQTLDKWI